MKIIMGKEYANDKETAARYGYSRQWFQICRHKKKGPPFVKILGKVYYRLEDTDKWFRENMIEN